MAVASRYINRELLLMLAALTTILLAVTVGGRFISYLQEAALGKYAAENILQILFYRLPGFLQLLLPFAWFLAVLLTLGRLHAEQEFEVLRGGGVGPVRLLRWLAPVAAGVTLVVGYLSLVLAPDSDRQLTEYLRAQQNNAEFRIMTPGVFHTYNRGQRTTYADSVDNDAEVLLDVFMAELTPDARPVTIRAQTGGQQVDPVTGARYLVLVNGTRYVGEPGRSDYHEIAFGRLTQRLEEGHGGAGVNVEGQSTAELLEKSDPQAWAELHFRLGLPLVVLIGGLGGVGVARTKPRQGRFAQVLPGLGLFISYYAALVLGRDAIADAVVPGVVGMWPVHVAFLAAGMLLLRRSTLPAKV